MGSGPAYNVKLECRRKWIMDYPWNKQFAIENDHRNSGFTHWKWWKWWFSIVSYEINHELTNKPVFYCHVCHVLLVFFFSNLPHQVLFFIATLEKTPQETTYSPEIKYGNEKKTDLFWWVSYRSSIYSGYSIARWPKVTEGDVTKLLS